MGDQGKTGSCVGWALADSVLRRQLVGTGRLAEAERLSPRFMWMAAKEMRAKLTEAEGGPGWLPTTFLEQGTVDVKSALDVARLYGAALERTSPGRAGSTRARSSRSTPRRRAAGSCATTGSTRSGTPPSGSSTGGAGSTSTGRC